ncbi:CBASS cGAMP-activated phospholipase [Phenylobacterium sp. LjRoot164]|uniref:CBASS cGAMP-activated phospholipase n=1 Tax=unclassified Phenylobacterium TaxID=2640670 RepID=UPI003ECFF61C
MTFQILCLSGGGFLGLYTAGVLAELEAEAGRPLMECFDLVAGTSVGGIIALGLAAGTPAAAIRDAIRENGSAIFSERRAPRSEMQKRVALLANVGRAKYRPEPLRRVIEQVVPAGTLIGQLRHRVMVAAVNLTKGGPQVFKTDHHETFTRDWKLSVTDVALATSAAPTFFPLHQIDGQLFADGGLYANAPDLLAIHEAQHFLGQDLAEVRLLSIGTTTSKFSISNTANPDMGWMAWMEGERLPSVMIASQQLLADAMVKHRLGDNYVRIDTVRSPEQERELGLDVATSAAAADLIGLAQVSVQEHSGKGTLTPFFNHRAAEPQFFNRK